ncbi:MAG: chemotaxis protein CheD [Spartobacteria bacterium]|nr:chemotaxis protein CheD [Spartobacteria bacterium]
MASIIVDISDLKVSSNPEDTLVTYSLGSCLGATFYDPVQQIGGMIHCMLPLSKIDTAKAEKNPAMFVDTGIPKLLKTMFDLGCRKKDIIVRVAGTARVLDHKGLFKIGERNYTVFRRILWKNEMMIAAEDVGGNISRTLRLEIASGRLTVKSGGIEREL